MSPVIFFFISIPSTSVHTLKTCLESSACSSSDNQARRKFKVDWGFNNVSTLFHISLLTHSALNHWKHFLRSSETAEVSSCVDEVPRPFLWAEQHLSMRNFTVFQPKLLLHNRQYCIQRIYVTKIISRTVGSGSGNMKLPQSAGPSSSVFLIGFQGSHVGVFFHN